MYLFALKHERLQAREEEMEMRRAREMSGGEEEEEDGGGGIFIGKLSVVFCDRFFV